MTEGQAFDVLRAQLLRLDADAVHLDGDGAITDVVLSDQDTARLPKPFAFIEILSAADTGEIDCRSVSGSGEAIRTTTRGIDWLMRVTVVGGTSPEPMDRLLGWRFGLIGETPPELAPFIVRNVGDPRRTIELVQTRSEPRAFMDVTLGAVVARRQRIDVATRVTVQTELGTASETDTYERP